MGGLSGLRGQILVTICNPWYLLINNYFLDIFKFWETERTPYLYCWRSIWTEDEVVSAADDVVAGLAAVLEDLLPPVGDLNGL